MQCRQGRSAVRSVQWRLGSGWCVRGLPRHERVCKVCNTVMLWKVYATFSWSVLLLRVLRQRHMDR